MNPGPLVTLEPAQAALATSVLCAAFFDYPVMRYVLGSAPHYPERLRVLIGLFVEARILRQDLLLGVLNPAGGLRAAALVTLPSDRPPPAALNDYREAVWNELGLEARARYEAFSAAAGQAFSLPQPHYHLNMIGVDPVHAGQGLSRILLDHLHNLVLADANSAGITLTTETPVNLPLYRHFEYREVGYARVGEDLETWSFFRPRLAAPRGGAQLEPGR